VRLLILSQYFWPENFRVNDLAAALVGRGHEVTVLTGLPNYPEGHVLPEYRRDPGAFGRYGGAEVVRVPLLARGRGSVRLVLNYLSFALSGTVAGWWRLRHRSFDAIFVFQPSPITACLPAIAIGRARGIPVLLWVLDLWPETLSAVGAVRSRHVLDAVGRVVAFIYRHCDLVLVQSRAFFGNVERYTGTTAGIRYFPGWAEPLFADDAAPAAPAPEIGRRADAFNVLFAGNIGDAQDFPGILDAAELLREDPRIHWLIVGDGRAAPWVRAEIERRDLGERISMLGRHPLERMPEFFAAADALLVTLRADPVFSMTIPGKVQTYLAAGLPLLGMLDGEGARVIEESGAGLTAPAGDSRALAAQVRRMASLPAEERTRLGQLGRAYCAREFDRGTLLAQLESWIGELLAPREPTGAHQVGAGGERSR
jgi:glycosyltransferase involved in cell wall biosynthesis